MKPSLNYFWFWWTANASEKWKVGICSGAPLESSPPADVEEVIRAIQRKSISFIYPVAVLLAARGWWRPAHSSLVTWARWPLRPLTVDTLLSPRVIRVKRQTGDLEMQDSGVSDIGACRLHSSAYCVQSSAALLLFVLSRIKCFTRKDITANSIQEHDFLQPVVSKSMNSQCSALLLCSVLTGGGVVTSYWNWSWHSRGVTIVIITTHSLPQMVQKCCENVAKRELTVSVKIHFQYYQWMTWCCCLKYWYCVWHW